MKIIIAMILLFNFLFDNNKTDFSYNYVYYEKIEVPFIEKKDVIYENNDKISATLTAYTAFCDGCSGITASGFDVRDVFLYNDNDFGIVRIVAADKSIPFGSIIRFSSLHFDSFIGIVLDRGGAIGFDMTSDFDILFSSYSDAINFGIIRNVTFEILRYGY